MVVLTLWILLFNSFSSILIGKFGVYATSMSVDRIIELTNEERQKQGLQTVKADARLTSAAYAKANNMLEQQYWDHFGPNGESPWQFITASGYEYIYAGENLGKGFTTSEGIHQAWMASPTHKENIMGANYKDIGIAIVSGSLNNENIILVVQMFGSLSTGSSHEVAMLGTPEVVQGDSEDGKTKSIRIVYPEEDTTYIDPKTTIKGETENFNTGSIVEIITDNTVLGEAKIGSDTTWEFKNLYDWKEGRNNVDAVISEGKEKFRDSVSFFISSAPPQILGVTVEEKGDDFYLNVEVEEIATDISLITGDKIVKGSIENNSVNLQIPKVDIKEKVFLVVSDNNGNFGQEDITKYFGEEKETPFSLGGFINFNISSIQRFATVFLAILVLCVLIVQIYFYTKAGRLKERSGDFVMVGVWWLIFLFGSFIGYSGTIY